MCNYTCEIVWVYFVKNLQIKLLNTKYAKLILNIKPIKLIKTKKSLNTNNLQIKSLNVKSVKLIKTKKSYGFL